MADRRSYFFRQLVQYTELDAGFTTLEAADRALAVDTGTFGICIGGVATQHAAGANMTVDLSGLFASYDQLGQRIQWSPVQNVDVSTDSLGNPTAVTNPGNSKIISVYAVFSRANSDPRTDGNGDTVYFEQDESFTIRVVQSSETVTPTPPALINPGLLLVDVALTYGQTTVVNGSLSITRRQDAIVVGGTPNALRHGTVLQALSDITGWINSLTGAGVAYPGGSAWFDGTTNPATTVTAQLSKIVSDLSGGTGGAKIQGAILPHTFADGASVAAGGLTTQMGNIINLLAGASGAAKVGTNATTTWFDTTTVAAGSAQSSLNGIVSALSGTNGAGKVGTVATGAWFDTTTVAAGSVQSQISAIVAALASTAGATKVGTAVSGAWFDTTTVAAGSAQSQINGIIAALTAAAGAGRIGYDPTGVDNFTAGSVSVEGIIDRIAAALGPAIFMFGMGTYTGSPTGYYALWPGTAYGTSIPGDTSVPGGALGVTLPYACEVTDVALTGSWNPLDQWHVHLYDMTTSTDNDLGSVAGLSGSHGRITLGSPVAIPANHLIAVIVSTPSGSASHSLISGPVVTIAVRKTGL